MQIHASRLTLGGSVTLHVTPAHKAASDYLYVPLDLPEGAGAMTVRLAYDKTETAVIDLGLFDPRATGYPSRQGFRGWSGGAREVISVSEAAATPGYVPGPMPAGRWLVALGLYRVPAEGIALRLEAVAGTEGPLWTPQPEPAPAPPRGPGWYRGDCHAHTFHSDAAGAPQLLEETARGLGLDFLFVTDHNTTTAWPAHFRAASDHRLLVLPGLEITTAAGHANVLGTDRWVDFRHEGDADLPALAAAARQAGALLSVNHDKPPIPWTRAWPEADCMEIFHEDWPRGNAALLERFDALLRAGRRITGIGGSDYHQEARLRLSGARLLGRPTTAVHVDRLDRAGVLAALRAGHVYVTEAPDGPHLELTCGETAMGDTVPPGGGREISVTTRGALGDRLLLTGEAGPIATLPIEAETLTCRCPEGQRYVRAEILSGTDPSGQVRRALSNPIHFTA